MKTKTDVKAGRMSYNHNQTQIRSLRLQTGIKAGVGKGDTQDPPTK